MKNLVFRTRKKVNKFGKRLVDKIRILSTPLNPQLIKIFCVLSLIISLRTQAQELPHNHLSRDTLTTIEATRIAIQIKNEYEASLELEEFSDLKKYDWTKYLPQVGYSVFTGFSIGYDLLNISRFLNDHQTRKAKRKQIWEKHEMEARKEFNAYLLMIQKRESLKTQVQLETEIIELERRLFEITKQKYDNHEITPTEYLTKEIGFKTKELQVTKLDLELEALNKEIKIIEDLKLRYTDVY